MHTLDEIVADSPVFEGLAQEQLELIAGCARNVGFEQGERLFREGDPADTFYLVRKGRVSLSIARPRARRRRDRDSRSRRDRRLVVAVSSLRLAFRRACGRRGARGCLRRRLPARQVRGRPRARLRPHASLRLGDDRPPPAHPPPPPGHLWLDGSTAEAPVARADDARALPSRLACPRDGRHVDAPARAARPSRRPGAGPVQHAVRVRRRRGSDLDERRARSRRSARAHDSRRRRRLARARSRRARHRDRRARPLRNDVAARGSPRSRPRDRRRRHRPRAAAAGRLPRAHAP